jgi:5-methylcytosine-specific restriction protein A
MAATSDDFRTALESVLSEADRLGLSFVGITAGALHRRVGGYPGDDHRMPVCCEVMRRAMGANDVIVSAPPKGDGATLLIQYFLPKTARPA